jgi:hypothetical protein
MFYINIKTNIFILKSCLHYAARAGSLDIIQYFINFKKVSPFIVSDVFYLTYLKIKKI